MIKPMAPIIFQVWLLIALLEAPIDLLEALVGPFEALVHGAAQLDHLVPQILVEMGEMVGLRR
jgi:hypothetical protein